MPYVLRVVLVKLVVPLDVNVEKPKLSPGLGVTQRMQLTCICCRNFKAKMGGLTMLLLAGMKV